MKADNPEDDKTNPFQEPLSAAKRPDRRRPRAGSILQGLVIGVLVTLASVIAFVATCVPVGFVTLSLGFEEDHLSVALGIACLCGLIAAIIVAYLLTRGISRRRRLREEILDGKDRP